MTDTPYDWQTEPEDITPAWWCPACAWTGWDIATRSRRHCRRCGAWSSARPYEE